MNTKTSIATRPAPATAARRKPSFSLGILNNYPDSEETRLFLTPEACGLLTSAGLTAWLEAGAGIDINYSDSAYADNGVEVKTRTEVLGCDVVLSVRPLNAEDTLRLRKRSILLTLHDPELPRDTVQALMDRDVTMVALDRMVADNGVRIFARLLDEIDGRAAILYAQEGLSFLGEGKGVLMGGIPGLQPCEVLIIGHGERVIAAAKAALQTGARVTLMDNDIAALDQALAKCGPHLITSSVHPKVLFNDVKHSDVIILDRCTRPFTLPESLSLAMKRNVYMLDLTQTLPSLVVPRTVAMAMSNVLVNFVTDALEAGGMRRLIISHAGVRDGLVTYNGHLVDESIAALHGLHALDMGIMLTETN